MRKSEINSTLEDVVAQSTSKNGRVSWVTVATEMYQKGKEGSTEMWRSRWRRQRPRGKRKVATVGLDEIERRKAAGENIEVWFEAGEMWFEAKPTLEIGTTEFTHLMATDEFKIALLSDTHIGSDKFAEEELHSFYDYAHRQGVTEFYFAGDISDGMYKNRDNSFYEQDCHGFQQQLEKIIRVYPKLDDVTTYFITGNHDVTHLRNGGANIGETLDIARDDLVYLGHNFAKVWLTEKIDLNLIHPIDGGAQAVSHKLQKIIDAAEGKRKSAIMAVGHYHKMAWVYWKGVHGFVMPSFQNQTDFMREKSLKSYIGGFILTIKTDKDGNLLSITPEYYEGKVQ
jgi:hypothetical protein